MTIDTKALRELMSNATHRLAALEAVLERANQKITDLRSIANVNGDWTPKVKALEAENQRLRGLLSDVTSVAITMLYNSHRGDVMATFTMSELADVVVRSEHLQTERVEHIYRRGYEALAAGGA